MQSNSSSTHKRPVLRHIANLWTLQQHPSRDKEWSLQEKLRAIRDAGFDGVCWAPSQELCESAQKLGLIFIGGMASGKKSDFPQLLRDLKAGGARHINVQLATDAISEQEALHLTVALMDEADQMGLLPAIEFHRGTCTETPEKAYALAADYERVTGKKLRISWDFSHFAVVKHLVPSEFEERLLLRRDLIQHAQQFHFRPFNGHHVQVSITGTSGQLTQEVQDWLPFAEAVLRCWLDANNGTAKEIFICPELGPKESGYALSTFPNVWEDTQVLRAEIERLWKRLMQ